MADPYPAPLADWYGCYTSRPDLFTYESRLHPAKMPVALCTKIFDHGQRKGYWQVGDLVVDPMAGQGTTLIVGAVMGYRTLAVELEPHFIQMLMGNLDRLAKRSPDAVGRIVGIIQGDARQLHQILQAAAGMITSPPYPSIFRQQHPGTAGGQVALELARDGSFRGYGAIIFSPPYGPQALPGAVSRRIRNLARAGQWDAAVAAYQEEEDKQIAKKNKWARTSPEIIRQRVQQALALEDHGYRGLAAVVTSPPYTGDYVAKQRSRDKEMPRIKAKGLKARVGRYGDDLMPEFAYGRSPGQIGDLPDTDRNIGKETYAIAMLRVYQAMHQSLLPGGVVCIVTKNPIKRGRVRRLDHLTMDLMRRAGFTCLERYRAMLAQDLGAQHQIFDPAPAECIVEKKSFWKRNFEGKHPHLKVDHEDVMFFRRADSKPCPGCGCPIHGDADACGECTCEDDCAPD